MSYYNYDKIRSYNALMNIIMTNRGFGKTYGFKDMAIKNFLKNGKQFMYIRRYKTDISKEKIELFFSDILKYRCIIILCERRLILIWKLHCPRAVATIPPSGIRPPRPPSV